ncbi:hypothetical protein G6F70_005707 [Rhizopus microsporus]|nr:hypothetical protein G6F71_005585 [Rhizopus microsporus]KAG1198547.1 hypothetical protein G6F70_005707 [Rhizopus microsporus]KAG1210228.1 hypothetical protein G6F69_005673 [Rhizopus microsporus]KAG1231792.1 hypothetical protein G6F67_005498 [Rhizopus microsporus]KAG1264214.1 hypothetical protein G6F68_004538 [Rhizopus microsporus]
MPVDAEKKHQLEDILSDNVSIMDTEDAEQDSGSFIIEEEAKEGFCVECMIHRTGKRATHKARKYATKMETKEEESKEEKEKYTEEKVDVKLQSLSTDINIGEIMENRAKYIPLRLQMEERKYLRLLEAALNVTEYTDKIDDASNMGKAKRIVNQIKELCAILTGIVLACDYKRGQELFADRSFEENEEFFQTIFEIGRRHKIMNPEKMRSAYGKLMYLLSDSMIPEVREMLGFDCVVPIKTVYNFLKERHGLKVLHEDIILLATREIIPDGKTRPQIQAEIRRKEKSIEILSRKYQSKYLSADEIRHCLYSIGDNNAYLRANRDPCEKMIQYLEKLFDPKDDSNSEFSLSIASGSQGHRLSHDHETQYIYVNQTLKLWREILNDMFKLWTLADQDILSPSNPYRLSQTGQGLHRVQACPAISREMHRILFKAQKKAGIWIGSSVIHLGDKNVPNALMFIDKYNQVARILNPVCITLDRIDELAQNPGIRRLIEAKFGTTDLCKKTILTDFFRFAFDGSGADNFYDAGSCIDGRLTSAWNWCSQIEKKPYFPIFLLAGFTGFDGGGW